MGASRSLPIILPVVPDQRWSCHSCGACCRELVGHLFDADRKRIDRQNWNETLDAAPYVRLGRGWVLNKTERGDCVFLDPAGLCRIHAKFGEAAKPLACRVFPFSLRSTRQGWQVSLRFDCPSVTSSVGKPISEYRAWLSELAEQLASYEKADRQPETVDLQAGVEATSQEVEEITHRFTRWIESDELSLGRRLIGAARITTTLAGAKLKTIRGPRFVELLDLLFGALSHEVDEEPTVPTARQRGCLRQLAFAHAEHVSLTDLRRGFFERARRRWQQLLRGRRFLKGRGAVPLLPFCASLRESVRVRARAEGQGAGVEHDVDFKTVESMGRFADHLDEPSDLLIRYLSARLRSRSVFGAGYYGWPVFTGLSALWLSIAAAGWLARYAASVSGHTVATLDDVALGIAVVDRAVTRLPALGSVAERARLRYLLSDDGVARLIRAYAPL